MAQQRFSQQDLETFRERFRQQKPDPKYLVQRRKSIRDLVVEVYPKIAEHMAAGHTVRGLTEYFGGLGVQVTESTLRNYIGYARRQSKAQGSSQSVRSQKTNAASPRARAVGKERQRPSSELRLQR